MNKSALIYLAALALTAAAQPIKWTASSTLAPQGKNRYDVTNLKNADPSVAWCEGVKGQGIGERVNAKIIASDSTLLKSLVIVNGYAKDQTTWKNNSRVKTLRLYVGGKHLGDLHLSDIIKPQAIQLPESIAMKGGNQLDLSFEIAEVYPGSKFEDACITGILFDVYVGTDIVDLRDKQIYRTVKIGTQTWMAQNLNFKTKKSKCYDNKESNCAKYGRLYDWEEARKICPAGWHLPSNDEWNALITYVGGKETAGTAGTKLKTKSDWNDYEGESGNGTDEYGFSALPGGTGKKDGSFSFGRSGSWWNSSGAYNSSVAYTHWMSNSFGHVEMFSRNKEEGYLESVRCVQGLVAEADLVPKSFYAGMDITDLRDGQTYRTVKIGNDTWMAQNLNLKTENSQCNSNKESNCAKYGRLYTWQAAMNACPTGWHLPSNKEWKALINYAGGDKIAGTKLKAASGWNVGEDCVEATDQFGFSALPGGRYADGNFEEAGGNWWTSSAIGSAQTHYMGCCCEYVSQYYNYKSHLLSVRCVKDLAEAKSATPTVAIKQPVTVAANSITDPRDKQSYRTVKIGNKTWMTQNLNFKTENSQCNSNKESNCAKYGRLYNWEEAMVACPAGWHLPGDDEWGALVAYAGGEEIAGTKLKATSDWNKGYSINKKGTDDFGFSALPGCNYNGTYFCGGKYDHGYWWSATNYEYNSNYAYYREIRDNNKVYRDHDIKTYLFSVRCVQEAK